MKIILSVLSILFMVFIAFLLGGVIFTNSFVEENIAKITKFTGEETFIYQGEFPEGTPPIVQKYFEYALKEGTRTPLYATAFQKGEFKTEQGSDWGEIKATQYWSVPKPAFVWDAEMKMASLLTVRAVDSYINGNGNILIKLLSSITISDAHGVEINESSLARWCIEAPLFPTALIPSSKCKWTAIDDLSAKMTFISNNFSINVVFTFDERGRVKKANTQRYRTTKLGYVKEGYTVYYKNYEKVHKRKIPTTIEVEWNTQNGDFKYGKFNITDIQYYNH